MWSREAGGDVPEGSLSPRGHHDGLRRPADHGRPEEHEVPGLGRLSGGHGEVARLLLRRHRLAGQRRLLHVKIPCREQSRIGGHTIAGRQLDNVAGDQDAARQLRPRPVTPDGGGGRGLLAEPLRGALGAVGLHEVQDHAEQDHEGNDDGVDDVAQDRRHDAGHDQDEHKRVREETEQFPHHGAATPPRRLVRSDPIEAPSRLAATQALRRRLESAQEYLARHDGWRHRHAGRRRADGGGLSVTHGLRRPGRLIAPSRSGSVPLGPRQGVREPAVPEHAVGHHRKPDPE